MTVSISEISYPSRYIDRKLGVAVVLVPGIEEDIDALLARMNGNMEGLRLSGSEHRAVGNFYATPENETDVYREEVYQFDIYLTSGQILPQRINDTAYQTLIYLHHRNPEKEYRHFGDIDAGGAFIFWNT